MIWLGMLLIVALVVALLFHGGREDDTEANPVAHYQRQLVELEQDQEKGQLDQAAAAAARLEIERRILRLADYQKGIPKGKRKDSYALVSTALALTVGAFGLYLLMGNPDVPSQPGQTVNLLATPVGEEGLSLGQAISKIEGHLKENPEDKQGWEVLARSARSAQAFSKAARAFGTLARLDPENSSWRAQELASYVAMANDQVTPAARLLLQALLDRDPSHPAGQYYLGMAHLQDGDEEGAKAVWLRLADRSPRDAPWMASVWTRLGALGEQPPALSKDEMDQVAQMSESERDTFIQSMIARLAARLESAPNDVEGWLMLARSQAAIGEKDAAVATLVRALGLIEADKRAEVQAFLDILRETPNS